MGMFVVNAKTASNPVLRNWYPELSWTSKEIAVPLKV
jgi:hypothetical protein